LLGQQFLDDGGVDHGAAECDPFEGVDKILDPYDPALEQIADAVAAAQEVDRRLDLNVRRQEQDPDLRELAANRARDIDAFKGSMTGRRCPRRMRRRPGRRASGPSSARRSR
jgi:hypothetical protein